jgi:hypothetical protein
MMRRELDMILQQLLARDESAISLDAIGAAIGAERITQDEIEQLLALLEKAGREIGGPTPKVRANLHPVLEQARRLKRKQNATPNVTAIAEATGLTVAEVRSALLYATVMGR